MNELDMIAAAQKGDVPSFNQLVRAFQSIVYHTAYRVLGDGDAASDATQNPVAAVLGLTIAGLAVICLWLAKETVSAARTSAI